MTTKKRNSAPRKRSEIARQLLELCASAKNWNEYELKVQFSKFLREGEKKRFARAFDRFLKSESNYTRTREGNRQPIKGKIIEFLRSHHLKVADDFLDPVAQQDDENAHLLRSFVKRNAAHNHAIRQAIGSYIVCYELSNVHLNKSDAMHFGYGRLDILYNLGVDAFQFTYRKEESALGYTDFEYKGYAICNSNQIFLLGFEQLVGTDCILLILA
jgi:hypothetical protein